MATKKIGFQTVKASGLGAGAETVGRTATGLLVDARLLRPCGAGAGIQRWFATNRATGREVQLTKVLVAPHPGALLLLTQLLPGGALTHYSGVYLGEQNGLFRARVLSGFHAGRTYSFKPERCALAEAIALADVPALGHKIAASRRREQLPGAPEGFLRLRRTGATTEQHDDLPVDSLRAAGDDTLPSAELGIPA